MTKAVRWYALAAVLVLAFSYKGDGAPILYVAVAAVAATLVKRWVEEALDFSPFTVTITPLRPFLAEKGLATPEQLKDLRRGNVSLSPRSPLNGMTFTLLRIGHRSQSGTLVFWPDFNSFSTEIRSSFPIEELRKPASEDSVLSSLVPYLHLKQQREGLAISLTTPGGTAEETIAILPWSEFGITQWKRGGLSEDAALTQQGWQRDDRDHDFLEAPFFLSHKYFEVGWRYI